MPYDLREGLGPRPEGPDLGEWAYNLTDNTLCRILHCPSCHCMAPYWLRSVLFCGRMVMAPRDKHKKDWATEPCYTCSKKRKKKVSKKKK